MKTSNSIIHPGVFLRTEILKPLGLDSGRVAAILAVPRPALSALLNGKASLDAEMAWRWEAAFDLNMDGLLRMQAAYDTALMRRRAPALGVQRYIPASAGCGSPA